MTTFVVALSKGGTTKTTTAAELVAELARRHRRVLAIDLDQQGNFTYRLGLDGTAVVDAGAADVLTGDASAAQAVIESPSVPGAHVLVGDHSLADLDHRHEILTALRDYLPELDYDDVVIDTPPSLQLVTLAGLAAADHVVVPVSCETEALDQVKRLEDVIASRLARRVRPGLAIGSIVPTRFDRRRLLDQEIVEHLHNAYPGKVTTTVREAVAVRDAYTAGQPVSVYSPTSGVAGDYAAAINQIIEETSK